MKDLLVKSWYELQPKLFIDKTGMSFFQSFACTGFVFKKLWLYETGIRSKAWLGTQLWYGVGPKLLGMLGMDLPQATSLPLVTSPEPASPW